MTMTSSTRPYPGADPLPAAPGRADRPVLRVAALYPSLLNTYADRGNLMVLRDRCAWRGIDVRLTGIGPGESLVPADHDLYYIGGGQDRDQRRCAQDLVSTKRRELIAAADDGALILGVCGGYQLLGHCYRTRSERLPGLGLLDIETLRDAGARLIGNIAVKVELPGGRRQVLAGFENHGGRTYLGETRPLGQVVRGHGNNGTDRHEGALGGPADNIIGTYVHGPLLAKNAWLADWLIVRALDMDPATLPPLPDRLATANHAAACHAAGV